MKRATNRSNVPARLGAWALLGLMPWLGACAHATGEAEPASVQAAAPLAGSQIADAQRALSGLGFYDGAIDGLVGPQTRAAVKAFQSAQHLPSDGQLTPALLKRLKAARPPEVAATGYLGNQGPVVEIGDAFVFSDGGIDRVTGVDAAMVRWQDASGRSWSSARGLPVALPAGAVEGAEMASDKPLTWPLRAGEAWQLTQSARDAGKQGWACQVDGRRRLKVPAGAFDTYVVDCTGKDAAEGRKFTSYYAPVVGHAVRTTTSVDGAPTLNRDLVAVRLGAAGWPAEARVGFTWALRHALDVEPSGKEVPWQSTAVHGQFVIVPGGNVAIDSEQGCRQFAITRTDASGLRRIVPGVACPHGGDAWEIPGDPTAKLVGPSV